MLECATEEATGSASGPANLRNEDAGEDVKNKIYGARPEQDKIKSRSGLEQD